MGRGGGSHGGGSHSGESGFGGFRSRWGGLTPSISLFCSLFTFPDLLDDLIHICA